MPLALTTVTIGENDGWIQSSVGATPQTAFNVDFPFFSLDDVAVEIWTAVTGAVRLYRGVDYEVSGTPGSDGIYPSGTVTLDTAVTNCLLTRYRLTDLTRLSNFPLTGFLDRSSLNSDLNREVSAAQDQRRWAHSAIRFGESDYDNVKDMVLPDWAEAPNKILGFDAGGNVTYFDPSLFSIGIQYYNEYNVRNYGGKGNGGDDSDAIDRAIAAAQAGGPTGTVVFNPTPTFYGISRPIVVPQGVCLRIDGVIRPLAFMTDCITVTANIGSWIYGVGTVARNISGPRTTNGIALRPLVSGNNRNFVYQVFVYGFVNNYYAHNSDSFTLKDVWSQDASGWTLLSDLNGTNSRIDNLQVLGDHNGVRYTDHPCEGVVIANSTILTTANTSVAIQFDNGAGYALYIDNVTVQGMVIFDGSGSAGISNGSIDALYISLVDDAVAGSVGCDLIGNISDFKINSLTAGVCPLAGLRIRDTAAAGAQRIYIDNYIGLANGGVAGSADLILDGSHVGLGPIWVDDSSFQSRAGSVKSVLEIGGGSGAIMSHYGASNVYFAPCTFQSSNRTPSAGGVPYLDLNWMTAYSPTLGANNIMLGGGLGNPPVTTPNLYWNAGTGALQVAGFVEIERTSGTMMTADNFTTNPAFYVLQGTGNTAAFGTEGSVAGVSWTGTHAYSTIIGGTSGWLDFVTGGVVRGFFATAFFQSLVEIYTPASTTANAGFNLPHGAAPSSPANGDVWTTTAGFFARINGVTITAGGASGTAGGDLTGTYPNPTLAWLSHTAGKTLAIAASLTLAGTDGSTLNVGTGGTLGTAAFTAASAYQPAGSYLTTAAAATTYAPIASPTFTGKATTAASAAGTAGLNLPHGAAPTTPANGDVWTTTLGLLARINGATVGPYISAASIPSSLPPSGSATGVLSGSYPNPGFAANPAFTGTVNATGAFVSTVASGAFLNALSGTTSALYMNFVNTGNNAVVGIEGSVAGTNWTGSNAYAAVFGGTGAWAQIITANVVRASFSASGMTLLGDMVVSENVNAQALMQVGNAGTGASTRSTWNLLTGTNRSVAGLVDYTGQYFNESGVNVPTRYSDFDTQHIRTTGGVELLTMSASGILGAAGSNGMGYGVGNGGTVAQITSKATTVVLSKLCGTITLNAAALAAATGVAFTWTNTLIAATDSIDIQHDSVGALGGYGISVTPAAGSATVTVRNNTAGSLSEAIVLRFYVKKATIT